MYYKFKELSLKLIIDEIKKILPPAKDFYELTCEEQRKINDKLQEKFGARKTFSTLASLEFRSDYTGVEAQKMEYELFHRGFNTLMVSEISKESKAKSLIYYFTDTVRIMKENLKSKSQIINTVHVLVV